MASKKPKPKAHPSQVWKSYDKGKMTNKFCPKCGPGIHLAALKDRVYC